jgi:replicative DNA helicase
MWDDSRFLHLERALIACVLQKPFLLIELDGKVDVSFFKSPVNRAILLACNNLFQRGYTAFDIDLLFSSLFTYDLPELSKEQLYSYLVSLYKANVSGINFGSYLQDFLDTQVKSKIFDTLSRHINTLHSQGASVSAQSLLDNVQTDIYNIGKKTSAHEPIDTATIFRDTIMDRVHNKENYQGIYSGMPILDNATMGWLKKRLYFVAARPKEGKSALLMQWGIYGSLLSNQDVRTLYLDTEMGTENEFIFRMAANIGNINGLSLLDGSWYPDEQAKANFKIASELMDRKKGSFFHHYIPGFKRAQVINIIKRYVYNHGVNLIIFDYFKEPQGGEKEDRARWQIIGDLSRNIKDCLGELDIPGLSALQQNRKGEGQSRTGGESLAETDGVLQVADVAFMLNAKLPKEIQQEGHNAGTHRLQLYRGRYTGSIISGINLRYYGYCFKFVVSQMQPIAEMSDANAVYQHTSQQTDSPLPTIGEQQT